MDIGLEAHSEDRYHIKCKHHECPRPNGRGDVFIHVHGLATVRPEVQDAMRVLLAELYASGAPRDTCPMSKHGPVQLHPMPMTEGPQTYLEPCLEPGIQFHTPLDLATIRGIVLAMDAGNQDAESRKEARGAEFVDDPEGIAAAIVQDVDGEAVSYSVMRGPATAQEGEAHSINTIIVGVQQADLPPATSESAPWAIGDSQSASAATKSYYENQKAHYMMHDYMMAFPPSSIRGNL